MERTNEADNAVVRRRAVRPVLTVRDPGIETLLTGLDPQLWDQARAAGRHLWRERNRWDLRRRGGGLFSARRELDRNEANQALRDALAQLREGANAIR